MPTATQNMPKASPNLLTGRRTAFLPAVDISISMQADSRQNSPTKISIISYFLSQENVKERIYKTNKDLQPLWLHPSLLKFVL